MLEAREVGCWVKVCHVINVIALHSIRLARIRLATRSESPRVVRDTGCHSKHYEWDWKYFCLCSIDLGRYTVRIVATCLGPDYFFWERSRLYLMENFLPESIFWGFDPLPKLTTYTVAILA
jgi:hypothetical protein